MQRKNSKQQAKDARPAQFICFNETTNLWVLEDSSGNVLKTATTMKALFNVQNQ